MVLNLFKTRREVAIARDLYAVIVAQARLPVFYQQLAAPDSVQGRFDLITLHAALVLRRLRGEGEAAGLLSQALFDVMIKDWDESLRELGVGDLSMARKMRTLGEAFYGRLKIYDAALDDSGPEKLKDALNRNIYGGEADEAVLSNLAAYIRREWIALEARQTSRLLNGVLAFAPPETE